MKASPQGTTLSHPKHGSLHVPCSGSLVGDEERDGEPNLRAGSDGSGPRAFPFRALSALSRRTPPSADIAKRSTTVKPQNAGALRRRAHTECRSPQPPHPAYGEKEAHAVSGQGEEDDAEGLPGLRQLAAASLTLSLYCSSKHWVVGDEGDDRGPGQRAEASNFDLSWLQLERALAGFPGGPLSEAQAPALARPKKNIPKS